MKKDSVFFENLVAVSGLACNMARQLNDALLHFDSAKAEESMHRLHDIEHEADGKKHEMMEALAKAFVTPIDRSDLIRISENLDDVLDAMDDVMMKLCITQVKQLRPDTLQFAELIVRACEATDKLMKEFKDFKKSKKIADYIVEINQLEEEGDRLYVAAMKALHTISENPLDVIVWRGLYDTLENVCDQCEDVADLVEAITIGNG